MALNDFQGEPVLGGTWMYDGIEPRRVLIVACNFDQEFASREDDRLYGVDDHREGEEPDAPQAMGPDGCLYYLRGTSSPGLGTVAEAKAWADSQPWGPVAWDE
jgi:hypothetical protein